jgi:hypothetical protein
VTYEIQKEEEKVKSARVRDGKKEKEKESTWRLWEETKGNGVRHIRG